MAKSRPLGLTLFSRTFFLLALLLGAGIALVLGIVGGSFFSMARSGGIAAVASKLTPHYWFNAGLVRMTGGQDWTSTFGPIGALLLFAVGVGLPGLVLAGRTVRP